MNQHSVKLGKECLKLAIQRWGKPAWNLMSDEQRRGAVCEQIVRVLLMVDAAGAGTSQHAFEHVTTVARTALETLEGV